MTREQLIERRDGLVASIVPMDEVLRGSLLERKVRHSKGCAKCAAGEGHGLWVLSVNYPGGRNRQISLRPWQVAQVREALERYQEVRRRLEEISELNRELLCMDRRESQEVRS